MNAIDMHLYFHCIIAVKYKSAAIQEDWQEMLHKCLKGIVEKNKHILAAISTLPDHVHLLIRMGDHQSIDGMMKVICKESAAFINKLGLTPKKFEWQKGYISVSVGRSATDKLIKYLFNQHDFHKSVSFREEFIAMLIHNKIEYKESDLFHELLDD